MNCRGFERQVADWVSHRLPAERACQMADHASVCASCTGTARTEEGLRDAWRATALSHSVDHWPRLAPCLSTQSSKVGRRRPEYVPRPVWALGGTLLLVAITVGGLRLHTPGQPLPTGLTRPASSEGATVRHSGAARWNALADVSQEDPAEDDPAGTNMKAVWIQIDTRSFTLGNATSADGR